MNIWALRFETKISPREKTGTLPPNLESVFHVYYGSGTWVHMRGPLSPVSYLTVALLATPALLYIGVSWQSVTLLPSCYKWHTRRCQILRLPLYVERSDWIGNSNTSGTGHRGAKVGQ